MSQGACSNIFKQSGRSFPLSSKKARIIHRCLAVSLYLTCWFTHPFSGKAISGNDREIPSEYPYVFPVSGYMGHCEGQAVSINGRNERSRTIDRCRLFCKFLLTAHVVATVAIAVNHRFGKCRRQQQLLKFLSARYHPANDNRHIIPAASG